MKKIIINKNLSFSADDNRLLLIAGPCQIESLEHSLKIAEYILSIINKYPIDFVFKASYDKANRTSLKGQRGLGIEKGLEILKKVKDQLNIPVITDIHTAEQASLAAEFVDILQIPAFLCRQTDILIAAGNTGKAINVKKGQFLAPADMRFCIEKIESTGNHNILLCERGTCFGYRDLVVDMRGLMIMKKLGYPVVFDATHSVQSMGGESGSSGGSREFIPGLAKAAIATGINALFIECHDNPDQAPSDSASMLKIDGLEKLLKDIINIQSALR
jgi:2-dehydro-3-deoxyphosphooctonate aldolase (KDO 8-P synthase)